ncbi:MAG: methyltransferase [Berryella intestinalis]|uniref:tRNA (guanine(46)-N(7))-methyltransferase TrmB n=1 Tax=Berryella intestinalis TaxID=1531429 RepID=UPI002A569BAA|nr:methyltransferase [Berryella intestinalis]MDD7369624.1 methyltransferase [Berryella intestinalis]MDY3129805.1 methyltransferase [Berryella intestinalis]
MTRTARSRKHGNFDLEKRLAAVEEWLVRNPRALRGAWRASAVADCGPFSRICVDLGCGKGSFIAGSAPLRPDTLFVGIDAEPVCSMHGAELARDADLRNALFTLDRDPHLGRLFASGEVGEIVMNFPTPFPQKKKAPFRLTHYRRLMEYRTVLGNGGSILLRTDSRPLFDYSLTQLEDAGYTVNWTSLDHRSPVAGLPATEYERKLTAKGARVLALGATPDRAPVDEPRAAVRCDVSLFDFLPDNLDDLEYIPHGMENAIENMRNRAARQRARTVPGR